MFLKKPNARISLETQQSSSKIKIFCVAALAVLCVSSNGFAAPIVDLWVGHRLELTSGVLKGVEGKLLVTCSEVLSVPSSDNAAITPFKKDLNPGESTELSASDLKRLGGVVQVSCGRSGLVRAECRCKALDPNGDQLGLLDDLNRGPWVADPAGPGREKPVTIKLVQYRFYNNGDDQEVFLNRWDYGPSQRSLSVPLYLDECRKAMDDNKACMFLE